MAIVDAEREEGAVVNTGHLMAFVDGQREEGNAAYKAGKHSEALIAWQGGLDAIGQARLIALISIVVQHSDDAGSFAWEAQGLG